MKYREMPRTGFEVSEVGFGVWTVSTTWWGVTETALRHSLLKDAYYEHGITFFDTSDTYGDGYGETVLKETLLPVRDKVIIATKFGYDLEAVHDRPGHSERPHNWNIDYVQRALENSLKRLGTDYIDLWQMHNPRIDAIENDELLAFLEKMKDEGKIRAYGAAMGPKLDPSRQADEAEAACKRGHHSAQIIFNLLEQMLGQQSFDAAEQYESSVLVRVPHSSGMLEGNLTLDTQFAKHDHRRHRPRVWLEEGLKKIETLKFMTEGQNRTLGQVALQFAMSKPHIKSALPNIYNHQQLKEFAEAPDTPTITAEELTKLDELYAENFGVEVTEAAM